MLTKKNPDKKINMFAGYCQEIRHLNVGHHDRLLPYRSPLEGGFRSGCFPCRRQFGQYIVFDGNRVVVLAYALFIEKGYRPMGSQFD